MKDLLDAYHDTLVRFEILGMQMKENVKIDSIDKAIVYSCNDSKYTVKRITLPCIIIFIYLM